MRRREFLRVASGAAGASAVGAGTATAQESPTSTPETATTTGTSTEVAGGGETVEVSLIDYAFEPGTDEPLVIPPGTTVNFVWETSTHNIVVDSQPEGADWAGHETVEGSGFEYSHTFEVEGTYEYYCAPHQGLGMIGTIEVSADAAPPGAEGAGGVPEEVDPEEMGVPIQAHFVGLATLLMLFISFVFTFYLLKYGETPHSGYPKR